MRVKVEVALAEVAAAMSAPVIPGGLDKNLKDFTI